MLTSLEFYDLPRLQPWTTSAGKCHRCNLTWSQQSRIDNFSADNNIWETIMNKMFKDWSAEKMAVGDKCQVLSSYINTAANVAASLAECNVIDSADYAEIEAVLRHRLFQPDLSGDTKPLWLYSGGKKDEYLTFGCIHRCRGTTLYDSAENFRQVIDWYFWQPGKA